MTTPFTRRASAPEQVRAVNVDRLNSKISQMVVERGNSLPETCLLCKYYLYPLVRWLSGSGGDHGLGQSQSIGMAAAKGHGRKSAWRDNRMIERRWRSLKCKCVYLNALETRSGMRVGISKWLANFPLSGPSQPTAY